MNKNNDITAIVGAETDVAPLGRDTPKPAHEEHRRMSRKRESVELSGELRTRDAEKAVEAVI